jgi:hypothetical protein
MALRARGEQSVTLPLRTRTSDLIAVGRMLLEPDDPAVCGPARNHQVLAERNLGAIGT